MSGSLALFTLEDGVFHPTSIARSRWSPDSVGGYAVCAMLAHELEPHCPGGFVPARLGVEMFRPVPMSGVGVTTTVVRQGNRIVVADASVHDGDHEVTRASATFLRADEDPPGETWQREHTPVLPPPSLLEATSTTSEPLLGVDTEWSDSIEILHRPGRKRMWQHPVAVLPGHAPTAFERTAMIADGASMVTHVGSHGVGFINCNVELAMCRPPEDGGVGVEADQQASHAGVSFGAATVYDRDGVVGSVQVSAIANARRQVDLAEIGTFFRGRHA